MGIVRFPGLVRVLAAIAVTLTAASGASAQTPVCQCSDLPAINYRLKEIEAAIKGYQTEIARISNTPYSNKAYRAFEDGPQQSMLDNMRRAMPGGAPTTYGGSTDPASCNTRPFPAAASACLVKALKAHEGYHEATCRARKGAWPGATPMTDYRDGKTLAEAYQQEIESYRIERGALLEERDALPDSCKPKGWYITYEVDVRGHGDRPPYGPKWSVSHIYKGEARMEVSTPSQAGTASLQSLTPAQIGAMTPAQLQALATRVQSTLGGAAGLTWRSLQAASAMSVEVDDSFVTTVADICKPEIKLVETHTLNGKGPDKGNTPTFDENTPAKTYNVAIQLMPKGSGGTYDDLLVTTPSSGSPPKPKAVNFNTLKIPEVTGLLEKGIVHHAMDQPLTLTAGKIQYDSGWVAVNPLASPYDTLPQAKQNMQVRVYYTISKFDP